MLQQLNQNPAYAARIKTSQQHAPKVATTLLMAICLWLLAGLIWLLIPHPELPRPAAQALHSNTSKNDTNINVTALMDRHLFGTAVKVPEAKPEKASSDAPETRLNLKLAGIILTDLAERSRALIADSNGKQKAYAVGDSIADSNAELHEINADHVVLERAGRYETLRLQKNTSAAGSRTVKTNSPKSNNIATELKSVRETILKDPSKAADFIRVRPVYSKGALKGYRIYPGKDRALFRKVGLRSGDLVTSVNGQNLNDPQKAFTMLSTLSSATSISLAIERRGRIENVSVDLDS